jgi:hypothetical protein
MPPDGLGQAKGRKEGRKEGSDLSACLVWAAGQVLVSDPVTAAWMRLLEFQ